VLFNEAACGDQRAIGFDIATPHHEDLIRVGRARAPQGKRPEWVRNPSLFDEEVHRAAVRAHTRFTYALEYRGHGAAFREQLRELADRRPVSDLRAADLLVGPRHMNTVPPSAFVPNEIRPIARSDIAAPRLNARE
jgi:hypothetical protein